MWKSSSSLVHRVPSLLRRRSAGARALQPRRRGHGGRGCIRPGCPPWMVPRRAVPPSWLDPTAVRVRPEPLHLASLWGATGRVGALDGTRRKGSFSRSLGRGPTTGPFRWRGSGVRSGRCPATVRWAARGSSWRCGACTRRRRSRWPGRVELLGFQETLTSMVRIPETPWIQPGPATGLHPSQSRGQRLRHQPRCRPRLSTRAGGDGGDGGPAKDPAGCSRRRGGVGAVSRGWTRPAGRLRSKVASPVAMPSS